MKKNLLLAISGPSGVGKGTLVNLILQHHDNMAISVSCTTRAPRENEVDGKDYFFLSREEFEKRISEDAFLEYDEHFGNLYGTPEGFVKSTLETKNVLLEIDVKGVMNVKARMPEAVTIFIAPPSKEELFARLRSRGTEEEEEIEKRVARAEYELTFADKYDYIVVNDDLQAAYEEIYRIYEVEQSKQNQ